MTILTPLEAGRDLEFEPYATPPPHYRHALMAERSRSATSTVTPAPRDGSPGPGEHIYIESEDSSTNPAASARRLRERVVLRNAMRHAGAELAFYEEGFLKVTKLHRGNADEPFYLDLRFVDPVPTIERVIAGRWLAAAMALGALAGLAGFLLRFDSLHLVATAALGAAGLAAAIALYVGLYLSHERIELCTLHGRVTVLELMANFGSVRKFRAVMPLLSGAIEEAAERIGADTAAFLRAEMREHYRLRGGGVIDNDECARGTGRILAQFDVQL